MVLQIFKTSQFAYQKSVVEAYFDPPVMSFPEIVGSPAHTRLSVIGFITHVSNISQDTLRQYYTVTRSFGMANRTARRSCLLYLVHCQHCFLRHMVYI